MKLVTKTVKKVVFESSNKEIKDRGFDAIWDEIRNQYPETDYELHTVEADESVFFELKKK